MSHQAVTSLVASLIAAPLIGFLLFAYDGSAIDWSKMFGTSWIILIFCLLGSFGILIPIYSVFVRRMGSVALYPLMIISGGVGGAVMLGLVSASNPFGIYVGAIAGALTATVWIIALTLINGRRANV